MISAHTQETGIPIPMLRLLLPTLLATALAAPAAAQDPNDPGIMDPVIQAMLGRTYRLPASHQVTGHSEQINLVGRVKKRPATQGTSATGQAILPAGSESPNRHLRDALRKLDDASSNQDVPAMRAQAQEIVAIVEGGTQGRIYDGFALLNLNRGGWLPDHVPGEHEAKRLEDRGRRDTGLDGRERVVWEVDVNLLYFDEEMDADTTFLLFPPEVDFRDLLYVNYTIYSTSTESFAPTTLLHDVDPFGAGSLPSKGYDAAWVPLGGNEITELTVDHGSVGSLRGIQVWGWYAKPDRSIHLQPVWESLDPGSGGLVRDPQGLVMMEALGGLDRASIGDAAPEMKVLAVAEAVLQGAGPATVQAMLNNPQVLPLGTHDGWYDVLSSRNLFPVEALAILAQEGIDPHAPGTNRLGPYEAILVYANHELYIESLDELEGHDPLTGQPIPLPSDPQGELLEFKVINLDHSTHYLQTRDYGPALHDDIATCRIAPSGGHSLEIFVDHPVQGAPKMAELQWRLGWGLREGMGTIPQFDVFSQAQDQAALSAFTDETGGVRHGWQAPAGDRGQDWRVDPPTTWLGSGTALSEGGLPGVVIGTATPGFGVAKMPTGDLAAFHPDDLLNADTDGDGVADALLFPDWLRNPGAADWDLIPRTREWEPFLYLNPGNGTPYLDPQDPGQGLWADLSYAFGQPIAAGSHGSFTMRRPRSQGQALWHIDGLHRESTGGPSRTDDVFTR